MRMNRVKLVQLVTVLVALPALSVFLSISQATTCLNSRPHACDGIQPIICLDSIHGIEVVTIEHQQDEDSVLYRNRVDECRKWILTDTNVRQLVKSAMSATSEEQHMGYGWEPCWYVGTMIINDTLQVTYGINAASHGWLKKDTVYQYLVWPNQMQYFITGKDEHEAD